MTLPRIKLKVRSGDYIVSNHCSDALADEGFSDDDAVFAVLKAREYAKLTGDETHVRYVIYGTARDGRALDVVVFTHQGTVVFKTAYESIG